MSGGAGGAGPPAHTSFIPNFSLPTTSGTSTFSFSLSGTSNSSTDSAHGLRYNGPVPPPPQSQFPFYPPMPGGPMGQSMMPPPIQGSQVMQHTPSLNLPTFGMDSSGSGMSSSTGGMGSSNTGPSGGDRSQRNASGSSGTSQSQHGAGEMSGAGGPAHYGMPYGGGGSNLSMNNESGRYSDTQRLSHSGSKNLQHRTSDSTSTGAPPSNQTLGNTPSNAQPPNRPVGRSPHNINSGSSFYPSNQFQSPPSGSQSQARNQSSGSQSSGPLPTPPLHHHGSRIGMDQSSSSSQGRQGYGSSGSQQSYGGGNSNFSGSSNFEPPPLHYTSNRPPSTQSTASNQSMSSQKSSSQSRSESRNKSSSSKTSQKSSSSSSSRSKQSSGNKKSSSSSSAAAGNKLYEVDTNLSNSIFETRSMTPMFPGMGGMGLSPPPPSARNLATDGPTYIPGNLFNAPRPLSNSNPALQHKGHPADMTFNPLFASSATRGPQNGLGLNFQPGFPPVNPHGSQHSSGHMTPHTTSVSMPPHIPNYLGNMFPEMPPPPGGVSSTQVSQSADSLNISPIKFQHGAHNPILGPPQPPPGLSDPSGLQHHPHQGPAPSLYTHNRAHPAMGINPMAAAGMSINSLLGQHHHGFDPGRGMPPGTTMAPPFGHVHTTSFGMPNFLGMHDH